MAQNVQQRQARSTPFDIWETGGVTEHMGGIYATQRLIQMLGVMPGQIVLDIGCGTGHTACYLAKRSAVRVVALDINPRCVLEARRRVMRENLEDTVTVLRADAHNLPLPANVVDVVIAESVLVFCDHERVMSEIRRILKPGGAIGDNELTFLKPAPEELRALLVDRLGIHTHQETEWQLLLETAGFVDVVSVVRRISLWEQIASHLRVDGLRGYLSAMVKGFANRKISKVFNNRAMLKAARRFLPYVGYGLYVGRKLK